MTVISSAPPMADKNPVRNFELLFIPSEQGTLRRGKCSKWTDQFVWDCDGYFWMSLCLMVSIFAPLFISAAEGTLMMSLVNGALEVGGGPACVSSKSMSKIKTAFGGMLPRPRSP